MAKVSGISRHRSATLRTHLHVVAHQEDLAVVLHSCWTCGSHFSPSRAAARPRSLSAGCSIYLRNRRYSVGPTDELRTAGRAGAGEAARKRTKGEVATIPSNSLCLQWTIHCKFLQVVRKHLRKPARRALGIVVAWPPRTRPTPIRSPLLTLLAQLTAMQALARQSFTSKHSPRRPRASPDAG